MTLKEGDSVTVKGPGGKPVTGVVTSAPKGRKSPNQRFTLRRNDALGVLIPYVREIIR